MKIVVGFIALCVIGGFVWFGLAVFRYNNETEAPVSTSNPLQERRQKAADRLPAEVFNSQITTSVQGEHSDILTINSNTMTEDEIQRILNVGLEGLRDIGFQSVVTIDKDGKRRVIDLNKTL